ncbi:hypothetical protein [Stenomitos frigidus]|nr:hypothetical protein [Stenomitos frigidus]
MGIKTAMVSFAMRIFPFQVRTFLFQVETFLFQVRAIALTSKTMPFEVGVMTL